MKNSFYFDHEAKQFEEALPLGNGRIGAMVFGDLKKERIALNEDTLWSGFPKDKNLDGASERLMDVRTAVFSNNPRIAENIMNKHMRGDWSESYLPFGDINIEYKSSISNKEYKRSLDLQNGVATVETKDFKEVVFVSHPDNLLVLHFESTKKKGLSFEMSFSSKLQNQVSTSDQFLMMDGQAPEVCLPTYYKTKTPIVYGENGMSFSARAMSLGDATLSDGKLIVKNQKEVTIFVSLATSYVDFLSMPDKDCAFEAEMAFQRASSFYGMLDRHTKDFSSYFSRVNLEIGDTQFDGEPIETRLTNFSKGVKDDGLIALAFQYGRYLLISASRPETEAMNLQGIWNEKLRAPWSSNYTININTEMNYWGVDAVNLSEFMNPLLSLVKKLSINGGITAEAYYECKGTCAHHNTDIWGCTQPASDPTGNSNCSSYSMWQQSMPWMLNMLYEHYEYTKDEKLKEELIPLFSGCVEFYNDFLIDRDGELVTCPSISPENSYSVDGEAHSATYMPSMDREILHDFFDYARRLGLEAPEIKQVGVAADGRIPEWINNYAEVDKHHRHLSHLYCIYPSNNEVDKELEDAALKSLEERGDGGTGWSMAWKTCLYARLGKSEKAYDFLKKQLTLTKPGKVSKTGGTYANMFCAHPPYQIDGNFGLMAGVAELIQSGNMPSEWNGKVSGIKRKDGSIIDAEIVNGKLVEETSEEQPLLDNEDAE